MWTCPRCKKQLSKEDQQHFCVKPELIDAYIAMQDDTVRPRLETVRIAIREAIPHAEERISWSMPTFWKGQNIIHFAAAKKHIGLYPGGEATEVFREQLKGYEVSKGTIRLPHNKELPIDLIRDIAAWCYAQYAKE